MCLRSSAVWAFVSGLPVSLSRITHVSTPHSCVCVLPTTIMFRNAVARFARFTPAVQQRASFRTPAMQQMRAFSTRYTQSHEWVAPTGDSHTTGITDYAQDALGTVVHVELPEVGATFEQGDVYCEVESTKAVGQVYAPVALEVVEVNEALEDEPSLVNDSPQGDGWLVKFRASAPSEVTELMDQAAYDAFMEKTKAEEL